MSNSVFHPLRSQLARTWAQKGLWCALIGCAAFLLFLPSAFAQATASISGTVHDEANALVPGAKMTLVNQANKSTRTATSNGEGYFNMVGIPTGTYDLTVSRTGFESWTVTGIEVHPGDSLTLPHIKLQVGQVMQSITVTATSAGVSLDSPEHSTLITAADIARLATTGRDALELVSILPGFTLNAGTNVQNQGPDYTTTSFGSGNVGAFGANGSAPQSGQVSITTDGAQVIDPGDMGATTANINMDQVQEVKVETSNFGADEAKGPIVINAVGKSGGTSYHGSLYTYDRNYNFNSNDWLSNYDKIQKTEAKYLYPGGTIGGPVEIPGTSFNKNKHLTFWAGFEDYRQTTNALGEGGGPLYAFIPTPAMLGADTSEPGVYDLSTTALASAFNVDSTDLKNNCTADYAQTAAYANLGGDCFSPANGIDQNGLQVPASGHLNSVNPAMATFTKFYPAINRVPKANNGYASDGFNWAKNVLATNNGFQFHTRLDESISDSLKIFGTYNWEKVNTENPLNNIYYNPPNTIPYPTPMYSNAYSHYASIDLTKVVNSSSTNELVLAGIYFDEPEQFGDRSLVLDTGTPWEAAGYEGGALKNGINQLPRIYSWEGIGIPNFSFGYVPANSLYLRKSSWDITDNFTTLFRTHTIKVGIYAEQTRNNNLTLGSDANGNILFDRYNSCLPNQQTPTTNPNTGALIVPTGTSLGNTVANFLAGCPGGYNQSSADPSTDMYYNNLEFYATDEWKVNSKLTLTYGIRISHLTPWSDSHGIGAAVWDPSKYNPIAPGVLSTSMTIDTSTWPGISWHKLNPSIPVAGVGTQLFFYQPRVGVSYDLFGNGKTVFRGGWGVYRSRDSVNVTGAAVTTAIDLVDHGITGNDTCTLDQLMNGSTTPTGSQVLPCGFYGGGTAGFTTASSSLAAGTVSVAADDPKDKQQPVTYNYNLTLDQKLPYGSTFEVAYVGNQSTNISTLGNLQNKDVIPLGAFFAPDPLTGQTNVASNISGALSADYRPYPNYTAVDVPEHTAWANYNALQASLNKQTGALVLGINYTWSKAMGVRGNYDTGYIADPVNAHHDYGVVAYDRPQVLNLTYSYVEGKKFHGERLLGLALNGWEISGVTQFTSGPDLAIINGSTNFGFSAGASYLTAPGSTTTISIPITAATWLGSSDYTLQPTVTCDPRSGLHSTVASGLTDRQYANGNCFGMPAQGTQGWWNLPDVHGPAYEKSDLTVQKDFQMTDRQSLQFRLAGFNFLNHPIPSFSNNNLNALDLTFGDQACNTTTGAGCYYSQQAAFAGVVLQNAGFGKTPFKVGQRILELGVKYNF